MGNKRREQGGKECLSCTFEEWLMDLGARHCGIPLEAEYDPGEQGVQDEAPARARCTQNPNIASITAHQSSSSMECLLEVSPLLGSVSYIGQRLKCTLVQTSYH